MELSLNLELEREIGKLYEDPRQALEGLTPTTLDGFTIQSPEQTGLHRKKIIIQKDSEREVQIIIEYPDPEAEASFESDIRFTVTRRKEGGIYHFSGVTIYSDTASIIIDEQIKVEKEEYEDRSLWNFIASHFDLTDGVHQSTAFSEIDMGTGETSKERAISDFSTAQESILGRKHTNQITQREGTDEEGVSVHTLQLTTRNLDGEMIEQRDLLPIPEKLSIDKIKGIMRCQIEAALRDI